MKRGAFVLYLVHVVLLKFIDKFKRVLWWTADSHWSDLFWSYKKTFWMILKVPTCVEIVIAGL